MRNRNPLRLDLPSVLVIGMLVLFVASCSRHDAAWYVNSAQSYLGKSDYKAAIIELKNALNQAPDNAQARILLARALMATGSPSDAEIEARKAQELGLPPDEAAPLIAKALLEQQQFKKLITEFSDRKIENPDRRAEMAASLAFAYYALDQKDEARKSIEAALAASPNSVEARVAQARLAAMDRDLDTALKLVDATLATAPDDVDALLLKADVVAFQGKRAESIDVLQRVIKLRPDLIAPHYALAANLIYSQQLDKAESEIEAIKKWAPKDPRTLYVEAMLAFARGNLDAARDALQRVVQQFPTYLPAVYLSGLVDLKRGAYSAAAESLRTVAAKVPDDAALQRMLAEAYLRQGLATRALAILEPEVRRNPNDVASLRSLAEVQLALNNPARAADLYEQANALDHGSVAGKVRLAQVRMAMGDSAEAYKDLESLSANQPTSQVPDLALISAHLRAHEYQQALAAVAALEKKRPDAATYNIKGIVYVAMHDFNNARASFEKALSIDPNFIPAASNLAGIDLAERNFAGARERYQKILAKDGKDESALLGLAEVMVASNAPAADIRAQLQRAVAANPTSVRARIALINYNLRTKNRDEALAAAQAAQATLPDDPQILEIVGLTQFEAGQANQAIATLRHAVEVQPANAAALLRLADVQAKTKRYDDALISLHDALAAQPDDSRVWVALAIVYATAGRTDAGIDDARRIQKERASSAAGFALEGELRAREKKWPEAVAAYRAAFSRTPSDFTLTRLHAMLLAAGKADDAAQVAQTWLKAHPQDAAARITLGEQHLVRKEYRAAAQFLGAAVDLQPQNVAALNNLAWVLGELHDPKGIDYARRAYELSPNSGPVADTYGWQLVQSGDASKGTDLLRKAVDLAPGNPEIRLHLAKALVKSGQKSAARSELDVLSKPETPPAIRAEAQEMLKNL